MYKIGRIAENFVVFDHIPLGMFVLRKDYIVLFWNRCLEEWTGIHKNKIIGKDITIKFPHLNDPEYSVRLHDIFQGGPPTIFSSQLHKYVIPSIMSNGKYRIQHTYVTSIQISDKEDFYALFAIQDVTDLTNRIYDYRTMRDQALEEVKERKRIEEALRNAHEELELRVKERTTDLVLLNKQLQEEIIERKLAEEELRSTKTYVESILANSLDLIVTIKKDGTIGYTNRQLDIQTGYRQEEVQGKQFIEFIPEDLKEFMLEKLREINEGIPGVYETQIIKADGTLMDCLVSQSPVEGFDEFLVSIKNITKRKKLENELLKVQKLESVGILAGGIAHDFNNLLTAILGNISLAKMYVMEREAYNYLVEIEKASIRAKDLTQQLLTFSRGGAPVKKTISIAELIKDSTLLALRGSKVTCKIFISPELWLAEVDEGQISQVINNLIINAHQAMPNGGTIQVQADNVTLGSENVLALKAGDYIKISVKDVGVGIPEENIQKIFDPFFTTKPNGSGLGLSTAYSIIKNHNGHLTVESKPGSGASFYIYLPAYSRGVQIKSKEKPLIRGQGKVLVMDDEEMVRLVTGKMLRHLGYEVEFSKNGEDAIKIYEKAKDSGIIFDAVIMDLTIPGGMGGKEAIKKLIDIDPGVKAIVASGYSNDPIMSEYKKYGFSGVVSKPFTITELGQVLHRIFINKDK